jgi:protein involved in polysaccharide export with SLBB domain
MCLGAASLKAGIEETTAPFHERAAGAPVNRGALIAQAETQQFFLDPATSSPRIVNERGTARQVPTASTVESAAPNVAPPAQPAASLPGEPTEFQTFVQRAVGRELPLFGHNFFTTAPSTFAPLDQVAVPADYVLGPGDQIILRAWGQIEIDFRATVDRNGAVYIPKIGELQVAGLRAQQLDSFVRTAVSRLYKNFELNVSLGQLRSIQIFIVGQARRPGSYQVGSLSTLVNALFASGGPSYRGSMRNIQLKRGGKTVTEFDLYRLLLNGDMSKDVKLLPGDVIFIPPVGPLAAVNGSVRAPAIYELGPGNTLNDALDMAGGLATTASAQRVTIERIMNRETRFVEEYELDKAGLSRRLRDGDIVNVFTLSPRIANAVTLRGNVAETMRFPWRERMKISDIIPDKDTLIVPDYWLRKNEAGRPENWLRQQTDNNAPGAEELRRSLVRGSVEINWEYAVIERLNMAALEPTLIPFNLGKAVLEKDPEHDLMLRPGDVITVFSVNDIRVPRSRRSSFVRLEGEFRSPGVYQIRTGETLRELVARIGGLTENAYLFGAQFTREATREEQQEKLTAIINRLEAEAERAQQQRAQSAITPEDTVALEQEAIAQRRVIAQYRQIAATGRIVLGIGYDASAVTDLPDLPLEDGDTLLVPPLPGTVNVFGAVFNQNAYIYKPSLTAGSYLAKAGGPTKDADKGSIYLVRADGTVISQRQKGWFDNVKNEPVVPGDSVVVPEDFDKFSLSRELRNWATIFYQFALGVAAISVLNDI